jgi:DNA repair protein RadC
MAEKPRSRAFKESVGANLRAAKTSAPKASASAPKASAPHYHGHRDRLRNRFMETGGVGMADYEILELVLFGASARGDTKPLAKALEQKFKSLAGVLSASPDQLMEVPGCGEAVVAVLKITREAGLRLLRSDVVKRHAVSSWQALIDYCRASMSFEATEQFRILFLDRKNFVIADEVQQRGTVDHTPVYPREVIKRALMLQASAIILVHNHPSGDPTPSRDDIDMTNQIREAGRALGVVLHDHVVVGREDFISFKSLGLL